MLRHRNACVKEFFPSTPIEIACFAVFLAGITGGNLGTSGSVSRMFDRKGVIEYDAEKVSEDEIMEVALEAGADDIVTEDGVVTVTTDPASFDSVLEVLQGKGFESLSAEVSMVPQVYTAVDADTAKKIQKLINKLEEDEDVQNVYTTVEYPEDFDPDSVA